MPLTTQERNWLERAELSATDPNVGGEGISIRIIVYLLRQIVSLREEVVILRDRLDVLEGP